MAVNIYWIEEPLIFATDYTGKVDETDSAKVLEFTFAVLEKGPLYTLVDLTGATTMPNNVFKMSKVVELLNHPNCRWLAIVGPNVFAKFVVQVLVRHKAKVLGSRAEAETFLRERVRTEQSETGKERTA